MAQIRLEDFGLDWDCLLSELPAMGKMGKLSEKQIVSEWALIPNDQVKNRGVRKLTKEIERAGYRYCFVRWSDGVCATAFWNSWEKAPPTNAILAAYRAAAEFYAHPAEMLRHVPASGTA